MGTTLTKTAFTKLINEDIEYLDEELTDCLEKDHIISVLKQSVNLLYPTGDIRHEQIVRYSGTNLDSLQCLRDVLAQRQKAAKHYLDLSSTDRHRRELCEGVMHDCDANIKKVIF